MWVDGRIETASRPRAKSLAREQRQGILLVVLVSDRRPFDNRAEILERTVQSSGRTAGGDTETS